MKMKTSAEDKLEEKYPTISWRAPLPARLMESADDEPMPEELREGLACRFCIAINGMKGDKISALPKTFEQFASHMREIHSREAILLTGLI